MTIDMMLTQQPSYPGYPPQQTMFNGYHTQHHSNHANHLASQSAARSTFAIHELLGLSQQVASERHQPQAAVQEIYHHAGGGGGGGIPHSLHQQLYTAPQSNIAQHQRHLVSTTATTGTTATIGTIFCCGLFCLYLYYKSFAAVILGKISMYYCSL